MRTLLSSRQRFAAGIIGILVFGGVAGLVAQVQDADTVVQTFDSDLYKEFKSQEVANLADLVTDFEYQQTLWMAIAPPYTEFWGWTQDAGPNPMPFAPAGFPKDFLAGLVPAYRDGVVVYPVTAWEDWKTRDRVFYNADGKEIGSAQAPQGYDPRWYVLDAYPDLDTRGWSADYINGLALIYEPSHLLIRYDLILEEDLIKWVAVQSIWKAAAAQTAALQGGGMALMRLPAADSNIVVQAVTRETNGVKLEIGYPDNFTNHLEIFTCTDLVPFWWTVTSTNLSTAGTNTIYWTDTDTNPVVRFFAVGNADTNSTTDPDGDGLTWAREIYLYHSSPTTNDTDHDGLHDDVEVLVLNTDPNNNDTNKPVAQISFPTNNYQWVWMP